MDLLIWGGKVSLYWLFFYGFFHFFLRKLTHFRWNRSYLLVTLLLPLCLPFLKVPESATEPLAVYAGQLEALNVTVQGPETGVPVWLHLLGILYFSGVLVMAVRFVQRLFVLQKIWARIDPIEIEDRHTRLYLLPDDKIRSFSFLNRIGISLSDYKDHFDEILTHEMVHVRQRHSIDILLTETVRIFFWFHPVLPLYKKSFRELHEFLADREIQNRDSYARFLVAYAFGQPGFTLVNNFYSSSLLKQRIQMLYQSKSPKWKLALYGVTGLLALGLSVIVAACSDKGESGTGEMLPATHDSETFAATGPDNKIFTAVEHNPEYPGGIEEMFRYLSANIKYPAAASKAGVSGRVFLQFVVGTNGSIKDIQIVKGIGFGCDEEAIRVVKNMPAWTPGRQGDKLVNVKYTLPINFELAEKKAGSSNAGLIPGNPLFLVDGREVGGLKDIDTTNIESLTVLKDSKMTAPYGEKGKNGVIIVKMKKP